MTEEPLRRRHRPPQKIGIDQVVWDTATNTLHVESDELLDQHTRYALIVTRERSRCVRAPHRRRRRRSSDSASTVGGAVQGSAARCVARRARSWACVAIEIAVASVFTTQSVTAVMEKIRDQIKARPAGSDRLRARAGRRAHRVPARGRDERVVSPAHANGSGVQPPVNFRSPSSAPSPGAVGQIAFGRFRARNYLVQPGDFIPAGRHAHRHAGGIRDT